MPPGVRRCCSISTTPPTRRRRLARSSASCSLRESRPTRWPVLLEDVERANRTFLSTLDVLIRLGLVVGLLSLGIVALRIVVERRHVMGVLRALGYKRRSIMAGLLAEALTTTAIGAGVGMVVGVIMGYLFYRQDEGQGGFGIDMSSLASVLALVFFGVLLLTALPAWRAARLPPAEAVHHSG